MINLQVLRDEATAGPGKERVPITRQALAQIVRELEMGRAALAVVNAGKELSGVMARQGCIDVGDDA